MSRDLHMDPELDFLSAKFDASKALSTSSLQVPCPEVQPCDNLDQYLSIVRGTRNIGGRGRGSGHKIEQTKEQAPSEACTDGSTKKVKSVLDLLKEPLEGPLVMLQECHAHQFTVQVLTRHSRGVRGMIQGKITAFDRHLNMILKDVTEYYTPLKTASNKGKIKKGRKRKTKKHSTSNKSQEIAPSSPTLPISVHSPLILTSSTQPSSSPPSSFSSCPTHWECTRHIRQLFIRGDNVILVRSLK